MDKVRRKVEEWGLVTISEPVAVADASVFSLGADANFPSFKDYLEKERTGLQASAAELRERSLENDLSATLTPLAGPAAAAVASPATPSLNLTGIAVTTTTANAAASPPASPPASPAPSTTTTTVLSSPAFAGLGALATSKPGTISERQAVNIAAGDKITERLLRSMTENNSIPGYSRVIFAIVEVSCNPGWRTRENYSADCSAFVEYYDRGRDRAVEHCERRQPTIFSVLPLIDAQTIESADGQRDLNQLSAAISAAFPTHYGNVSGSDILKFVQRYQKDSISRTPRPVVNTYSTGRVMGFRFSPSFQGLRDPAVRKSGAANVLLPTTFPALVTIVLHQDDLRAIQFTDSKGHGPRDLCLMAHISTRWLLNDRPPLAAWYRRLVTPMARETSEQRIDLAGDVARMFFWYKRVQDEYEQDSGHRYQFDPIREEMRRDVLELESKGIGQSWPIPFTPALVRALDKTGLQTGDHAIGLISPSEVCEGESVILTLAGAGLRDVQTANVGGVNALIVERQTGLLKVFVDRLELSGDSKKQANAVTADARLKQTKDAAGKLAKNVQDQLTATATAVAAVFQSITGNSANDATAKTANTHAIKAADTAGKALRTANPALAAALAGTSDSIDASQMEAALGKVTDAGAAFSSALDAALDVSPLPADATAKLFPARTSVQALTDFVTRSEKTLQSLPQDLATAREAHAALPGGDSASGGIAVTLTLDTGEVLPPVSHLLHVRKTPCTKEASASDEVPAAAASPAPGTPPGGTGTHPATSDPTDEPPSPPLPQPTESRTLSLWPTSGEQASATPALVDRGLSMLLPAKGDEDDLPSR